MSCFIFVSTALILCDFTWELREHAGVVFDCLSSLLACLSFGHRCLSVTIARETWVRELLASISQLFPTFGFHESLEGRKEVYCTKHSLSLFTDWFAFMCGSTSPFIRYE